MTVLDKLFAPDNITTLSQEYVEDSAFRYLYPDVYRQNDKQPRWIDERILGTARERVGRTGDDRDTDIGAFALSYLIECSAARQRDAADPERVYALIEEARKN